MKSTPMSFGLLSKLLKETFSEWSDDNAMRLSAALSYYSVFSIAPLLLIAISLAGAIYGKDAAQGKIASELGQFIGAEAAKSVQSLLQSASKTSGAGTLVGFATLFIGASTVFGQLKEALNTIWSVRLRSNLGISGFLKERVMSFGMVLVIGFLLLVSLLMTTALAEINGGMKQILHVPTVVGNMLGFVVSLGVESLLFGLLFKVLPDAKIGWRTVWRGAVATAVLFEIGKSLLGWYLGQASTTSSFGAAGSVVVLLLWVFYASCILFLGAEFTKVYAREVGCGIEPSDIAEFVSKPAAAIARVPVQPHPLTPEAAVPALPMKESLAPLLVTPHLEHEVLRATRLPRAHFPARPATPLAEWLAAAHEHPVAEIGAALGVGLLAGLVSRLLDRPAAPLQLSAGEHFQQGARKTAVAGGSLLFAGTTWLARHLSQRNLNRYGNEASEQARKAVRRLAHQVAR